MSYVEEGGQKINSGIKGSDGSVGWKQTNRIWKTSALKQIGNCLRFQGRRQNFPNVCAVLVQDSWNFCSGEQELTTQHLQDCLIFCIQLNHIYKIKIKNKTK